MKSVTLIFFIFCSIFGVLSAEKARFDFYRLYEVAVDNEVQLKLIEQMQEYPDGVRVTSKIHQTFMLN